MLDYLKAQVDRVVSLERGEASSGWNSPVMEMSGNKKSDLRITAKELFKVKLVSLKGNISPSFTHS